MRLARNKALTDRMPFLFQLLKAKLNSSNSANVFKKANGAESDSEDERTLDPTDSLEDFDGSYVKPSQDPAIRRANRVEAVRLARNSS